MREHLLLEDLVEAGDTATIANWLGDEIENPPRSGGRRRRGYDKGYDKGSEDGFNLGHDAGYSSGYNDAVDDVPSADSLAPTVYEAIRSAVVGELTPWAELTIEAQVSLVDSVKRAMPELLVR